MKAKKLHLEILFNLTKGTFGVLGLAEARIRDSFIKPLQAKYQEYLAQREEIFKTFCIKDEQGNPALVNGNQYEFPNEKLEELNKELVILADEEVEVYTTDNPKQVKAILEKSEYKPTKIDEPQVIDELLSKLQ